MADNLTNTSESNFKEAVCIDAGRVYDSCCDRDCVENLRCYFSAETQALIENATSVRLRCAEVLNVFIDVEPVNFNRGYYSCDLTFLFLVRLDLFTAPHSSPNDICGVAVFNKRVILYGSEGNVKTFSNKASQNYDYFGQNNTPRCVVQTVEPIALSAHIGEIGSNCDNICALPDNASEILGGTIATGLSPNSRTVYVTLGLFSVIQLIRNVQMLIPVYDFCIPEKQCTDTTDQPCDVFRRIKFPTEDFFPPQSPNDNGDCGCG